MQIYFHTSNILAYLYTKKERHNTMAEQTPHQGKTIELAVKTSPLSIIEVAEKLKINRRTVYQWFAREELTEDIIVKVGDVIGVDLYDKYPGVFNRLMATPGTRKKHYPQQPVDDDLSYKDKYIQALEEINELRKAYNTLLRQTTA